MSLGKIDPTQHPEYTSLMKELDQSKLERLQRIENWQKFERQSIHDWFAAQKKQAWDDFYVSIKFSFASERGDLHFCVMNYPSPPPLSNGRKTLSLAVRRCTLLYLEKVSNIYTHLYSLLEKRYAQILFKMCKTRSQDSSRN